MDYFALVLPVISALIGFFVADHLSARRDKRNYIRSRRDEVRQHQLAILEQLQDTMTTMLQQYAVLEAEVGAKRLAGSVDESTLIPLGALQGLLVTQQTVLTLASRINDDDLRNFVRMACNASVHMLPGQPANSDLSQERTLELFRRSIDMLADVRRRLQQSTTGD